MGKQKTKEKGPIAQEKIFRVMMLMTLVVSGVFLLKNVITQAWGGAIAVGVVILVFLTVTFFMKKLNFNLHKRQLVLCVTLPVVVFVISIFSGAYYSDDFPLFLAVVGLGGLYMEPMYTKVQMIEIPIFLIVMYVIHPEKADSLPQYLMCVGMFVVASFIFYMTIVRGRAFIDLAVKKAEESAKLLVSIKNMGEELQQNYQTSNERINGLREANQCLESNTDELKKGSEEITNGARQVELTCDEVKECMQITENHIDALNKEVKHVEEAMSGNKQNMLLMDEQMQSVKKTVDETKEVFAQLQQQIKDITEATEQLTGIAANTKLLALNASIEAARAGEAGSGFAVVASQVQSLAFDSNSCSEKVISIVNNMKNQIEITTAQLEESDGAINNSIHSLGGLESGFEGLIQSLNTLYENIEEQNKNVNNADSIFGNLKYKIDEMSKCSEGNQEVVESIIVALSAYQEHMNQVIKDAKDINELSSSMLELYRGEDIEKGKIRK